MDLLKRLFKGDKVIWVVFMLLCLISIIEVFSAASTLTYKSGDFWAPISQHSLYIILGVGIVLGVHKIPCKLFRLIPVITLPTSIILLIITMVFGEKVNGAGRWLPPIFGIQFQPSELAKMAVITSVALILSMTQEKNNANPKAFKYIMIITTMVCVLIAPENFSTAALLFGVVVLMMFIGQVPLKQLGKMFGIIFIILGLSASVAWVTPDEVLDKIPGLHRVTTWKHRIAEFNTSEVPPEEYDIDKNAQKAHANIAIATSHLIGKMPGNSVERDFLSQAFSDFIFAIIIEELGLVGGISVIFLYLILLIRVGRIAAKCQKKYLSFMIMGIAILLVAQALLNMMVAVGLFPITGQPLPFISKGGTSTLINCVYIGIILSVSRYIEKMKDSESLQSSDDGISALQEEYPLILDISQTKSTDNINLQ